jgi:tRNA nucleotidyltransferase/poly(A) polymerase
MAEHLQGLVRWLSAQGVTSYLVGGCVRDLILERPSHDLDVIVAGDALSLGRKLANRFNGAFYVLDAGRGAARVLLPAGKERPHPQPLSYEERGEGLGAREVDFTRLLDDDLSHDLAARDFTVNAMALPVRAGGEWGPLVDPHGGQDDLSQKRLRAVSATAFQSDPIRVLRAVRLAHELGLSVEPQTAVLAREAAPLLAQISAERVRDELCRLLDLSPVTPPVKHLLDWGAWRPVAGEEAEGGPAVEMFEAWDALWAVEAGAAPFDAEALALARGALAPYRERLASRLAEFVVNRRSRGTLLKWAALLLRDGGSHAGLEAALSRFRFSNTEIRRVKMAVESLSHLHEWLRRGTVSRPELHRFYRRAGDCGPEALLLALCLALTRPPGAPGDRRADVEALSGLVGAAWEAYFASYDSIVAPPRLLDGTALMVRFGLAEGPQIRELLEQVQEAQAAGTVTTPDEALRWVERALEDN